MATAAGMPVWYELLAADLPKARKFYASVVGWTFVQSDIPEAPDYWFLSRPGGGATGGAMQLTDEMVAGGGRPIWLMYLAVEDVDAKVAAIEAAGGSVLMPAFDLNGVGRMALVKDPQGIPFYVMRGFSDQGGTVFSSDTADTGMVGWHELQSPSRDDALDFYGAMFGYAVNDRMEMGPEHGPYCFLDLGGTRLGGAMQAGGEGMAGWLFYFRVPDIEAAKSAVEAGGGTVVMGPQDVPGDEVVVVARDPDGAAFGLVAPRKG